jgi:hypothetical protein
MLLPFAHYNSPLFFLSQPLLDFSKVVDLQGLSTPFELQVS